MSVQDHPDEIYIGATVSEWSDRQVLAHLHAKLAATGEPFILLANLHIGGRQVDCVAVTKRRVVVVEAKMSKMPVRGDLNGDWSRQAASGEWLRYANGYEQALAQKNRLRDAMAKQAPINSFYPDAAVVFVTGLAEASQLTPGDKKVCVTALGKFDPTGNGDRANPWSRAEWQEFATSLSLRRASLDEVMAGEAAEPAYALLRDYHDRMASESAGDGDRWLPEHEKQRAKLLEMADCGPGCYIQGPTGCGKTLAARWLGCELSRLGSCVIFLSAKDFDGSWSSMLKRELALVMETTAPALLGAARITGTPVTIVLDGINELGAARDTALRGLRALGRRYDACVIATGQSEVPAQLRGLAKLAVTAPSLELKERIARARLPTLGSGMRAVLKAVTSGFEAAIVAEIGAGVTANASRQLLVDQFIRQRLGPVQRSASLGLRRFAQILVETTSFSLGETAFDELMRKDGLSSAEVEAIFTAGLAVRRGGRVSFAHEILLNASAAFFYAQLAPEVGEKFAILLSIPVLQPIAIDILSVIEDPEVVAMILRTSSAEGLICEAARGLAGPIVQHAASQLLKQAEDELEAEIAGLRLEIVDGERTSLDWQADTVRTWSDPERGRLTALAREIGAGHRVERYFALCAVMDRALVSEQRRMADQAEAAGMKGLRSASFRLAYFGDGRRSGFARISQTMTSGLSDIDVTPIPSAPRDMMALTPGQLHFYLDRRRLFLDQVDSDDAADQLAQLVRERFRYEVYHVKLAMLETCGFLRTAAPPKVQALVEAIETIDANREHPWISTAIIDALNFLGALEDSAQGAREGVAAEFARAVAEEDEFTLSLALGSCVAMFDHPYGQIYWEEFHALAPAPKHLLLRRAVRAEGARNSFSLGWILREIASFEDPADAGIMQEFARLPGSRNSMPQEEWGAFTFATRHLGRYGLPLPAQQGSTDAERALIGLQALLHATEREADSATMEAIWQRLTRLPATALMGCLSEVEHTLQQWYSKEQPDVSRPSLLAVGAPRWLEIARQFLDSGEEAKHHHFAWSRDRAPDLAIQIIETHGDRSDLARLRRLANGSRHAPRALEALRKLDGV